MKQYLSDLKEMRSYLLLWFTQMISGLGSAMTGYALVVWSYTREGSALRTALLHGVFLRAIRDLQHFCRCAQRPLGQKRRPCCGATHWRRWGRWRSGFC